MTENVLRWTINLKMYFAIYFIYTWRYIIIFILKSTTEFSEIILGETSQALDIFRKYSI